MLFIPPFNTGHLGFGGWNLTFAINLGPVVQLAISPDPSVFYLV